MEALQTLADFSYSFFHVEGKDKNLTELPLKAVKWLIDRQGGRRNTLNKMEDELKQLEILVGNTLEESARKIDIKKKLFQQNSIVQELDEEEGSRQMTDLKKSCEYLNTIFINILSNAASSRAMKLSFDARLDHLEENLDESVVKLIFSVYPLIVSWPIDHSCRSKL